jgi:hypothetical protein
MTRNPDMPCTRCGKPGWRKPYSKPATYVCRPCRAAEPTEPKKCCKTCGRPGAHTKTSGPPEHYVCLECRRKNPKPSHRREATQ